MKRDIDKDINLIKDVLSNKNIEEMTKLEKSKMNQNRKMNMTYFLEKVFFNALDADSEKRN